MCRRSRPADEPEPDAIVVCERADTLLTNLALPFRLATVSSPQLHSLDVRPLRCGQLRY